MAWGTIKQYIASKIYENGNAEITGAILQGVLNTVVDSLGAGFAFAGIASFSTTPGEPDGKVFYIATEPGTYASFGLSVGNGELAFFMWDGTSWYKQAAAISAESGTALAYSFGGIVNGVTPETSSTVADSGAIKFDNTLGQFILAKGLPAKYYLSWAAGAVAESSLIWNGDSVLKGRKQVGNRFYIDNGDGTMNWFYYDGVQMLETTAATNKDVTEVLTDHEERIENAEDSLADVLTTVYNLGEFPSVSEGLTAAAEKSITENRNIRLIIFRVPSLRQSVNILQQQFNYITTQVVFLEGKSRTSYQRSITTGDNYVVGDLQQLHLYTTIQVEGNELVGYTADTPDSPNTKRTVICSLDLDSVAALETQAMRTIIEVAGVDYTTTAAPTSSTGTKGLPLYWLARPAVFAVKSGTTYYTMPSTDERFAACGLRRVGQLFKCGGETFYLDADLNPVFVNSSVRFDRSGAGVKVYPSNSTLRSLYEAAGAVWNEDTGYYELNGVKDIDEEEMQGIFVKSNNVVIGGNAYYEFAHRTIIRPKGCAQSLSLMNLFAQSAIISAPDSISNYFAEFPALNTFTYYAKTLRIIGQKKVFLSAKSYGSGAFAMAKEIVQVRLRMETSNQSIPMPDCVRISYYTLKYLAENWTPTAAVTVTLPTPQATIINTILGADAGEVADLLPEEQNFIFQQLAQMPWEAKLKTEYTQPIWREDNGSTIAFTNRMPQLDEAGETYTFQDVTYNDVRPSLIKHEKGANGEYIYAAWYDYVNKMLATDRNKVGTELVQYTTALNTNFAVSIYDWIDLANKFGAKGITIADGGAAAASEDI